MMGPKGKSDYGNEAQMPEPQEYREANGEKDVVTDIPTMDPFELKAPEDNHTPNMGGSSKPNYGKHEGRGNGGVGL
jgi:hypothetical protein